MKRIVYLAFDQLNLGHGALKHADRENDLILFVESQRMVDSKKYHPQRIFFLISSVRHFCKELAALGFEVSYREAATSVEGILAVQKELGGVPVFAAYQSSFRLQSTLESIGTIFCENDFFLTPKILFEEWAEGRETFLMENFYRKQRVRLNILMDGAKPMGGQWNFDKENREPLPKNYSWPPYLEHDRDDIDYAVARELEIEVTNDWATTRAGALLQLEKFLQHHFADFGRYEDAMSQENWAVNHSLLSPYLNNGLLHPREVVGAAINKFSDGSIPIASCEAFIRQIIGWREYINGMYWHLGEEYRSRNGLAANRELLPLYIDPTKTKMNCLKSIVTDVNARAWVHHIPRLMVLSNLALLTGVNPEQFLGWMRNSFIDATDWVMVPNVIGMGLHADGGQMMTKPYAAGGAYISRMSDYCKGCAYNPKERVGEEACPFTTLYWNFLYGHEVEFSTNHRMSQQLAGLKRLTDLPEIQRRAHQVLEGLDRGDI